MNISAFDLDHTLISDNSSFRFGLYLCRKRLLPLSALFFILLCYARHSLGLLSIAEMHRKAFQRLFRGRSQELIKQQAEEFLQASFNKLLYLPALEKLKQAQEAGHLTVILSSSPEFIVGPIASRLNVSCWLGTKYAVDKDHHFCHIAHTILSEDKVKFIDELCHQYKCQRHDVTAYSDSHLDLPFLLAAGTAVGVNPDRKLSAFCRQRCWQVI